MGSHHPRLSTGPADLEMCHRSPAKVGRFPGTVMPPIIRYKIALTHLAVKVCTHAALRVLKIANGLLGLKFSGRLVKVSITSSTA